STEDYVISERLNGALGILNVDFQSVIMDTYNETFAVLSGEPGARRYTTTHRREKTSSAHKFKTHKGHAFNALTKAPRPTITSSRDVFQNIYGYRFGNTPKSGMLVLDRKNRI